MHNRDAARGKFCGEARLPVLELFKIKDKDFARDKDGFRAIDKDLQMVVELHPIQDKDKAKDAEHNKN